jgi:polysaccharide pyruvyl transferase WcaK-like protein
LRIAQLLGVKTMLYSNGIGPVARPFNKKIAASVLNRVDVITLRESDSLTFLEASHITRPQIYLTADETLTMTLPPPKKIDRMLKENGIEPDSPFLCVSLRPWKNNPPGFVGEAAAALDEISAKRGLSVLLIPMQLPDDIAICQEVQSHMERKCLILQRSYSPPDLIGIISRSQAMLGMRLHALIYAAAAGIPVGGVVYDNKITAFLRSIRQNNYIGADNLTKEGVLTLSERIFDNYEEACRDMDLSREKLRALALSNSAHALALLDGKTGREET